MAYVSFQSPNQVKLLNNFDVPDKFENYRKNNYLLLAILIFHFDINENNM